MTTTKTGKEHSAIYAELEKVQEEKKEEKKEEMKSNGSSGSRSGSGNTRMGYWKQALLLSR